MTDQLQELGLLDSIISGEPLEANALAMRDATDTTQWEPTQVAPPMMRAPPSLSRRGVST